AGGIDLCSHGKRAADAGTAKVGENARSEDSNGKKLGIELAGIGEGVKAEVVDFKAQFEGIGGVCSTGLGDFSAGAIEGIGDVFNCAGKRIGVNRENLRGIYGGDGIVVIDDQRRECLRWASVIIGDSLR